MAGADSKQFVVFKLGEEEYGIDVSLVREIHIMDEITRVPRSAAHIEGVMNLRGRLLTVVNLRKRFGMGQPSTDSSQQKIVVVDAPEAPVGLMVDEVTEVARVENDAIEKAPEYVTSGIEAQYIIGIAKHGDRLITIIDPIRVLELSTGEVSTPGG